MEIYSSLSTKFEPKMNFNSEQTQNQDTREQLHFPKKKNILPAKQIITKNYKPDTHPQLKLVPLKQTLNQINNRPDSLLINDKHAQKLQQQRRKYKPEFSQDDSLGYHYKDKFKNNLLYIKFDNKQFYTCQENKCKYIAGFFIHMDTLLKPEIKLHRNLYAALQSTSKLESFFNYEERMDVSFKENCFSAQNQVKFSSNYESSNLFMAIKKGVNQFDLILQNDINSKGTTQWFNFTVQLPQKGLFKFNIVNLTKSHSLFQKGMGIPVFSHVNHQNHNRGWVRGCSNITYQKSQILREGQYQNFYCNLHFEYDNEHQTDTVTFSYGYPYTGIDLQKFFSKITQRKLSNSMLVQRTKIAQTLSGLPVYAYHIYPKKQMLSLHNLHKTHMTLFDTKYLKVIPQQQPKGIVFMSRQHPGQSQSSFILQGIVDFILQNNEYDNIKKSFQYYILPMVNADGVYYGNYRTNLSGNDLNRIWKQPRKDFHPEIYSIKKYLYGANRMTEIKLIIDLHGHSSALNSFFYGNPMKKQGVLQLQGENSKLFPYYCSKQMKEISFVQSTFSISESKKNSARVVLNEMFPKASVYTLQTSFYGYKKGKKIVQFTIEKYKRLGREFISTYLEYNKITQRVPLIKQKWQKQIEVIQQKIKTLQENNDIASDSDSEAPQQLIEFEKEFESIDLKNFQENKQKEGQSNQTNQNGDKNYFGQRSYNIHQRLYDRRKLKVEKNNTLTEEQTKKSPYGRIFFHDSPDAASPNNLIQLGFLSIMKISTKNPVSDKKDKSKIQRKTTIINEKGFLSQQIKQDKTDEEQDNRHTHDEQQKMCDSAPNTDKIMRKQYSLRSFKQKNSILRERQQIKYINEKQFLRRRRKSLNKSIKLTSRQMAYDDGFMEGGALIKSIVHSKPPHVLLNMQNKKKKMYLETTALVDVEEDKTQI